MKYKITFIKPNFPSAKLVTEDYKLILKSNWFTNFGPFEKKFSAQVADYLGKIGQATTVANATLGLQVAIQELFPQPGHLEKDGNLVITPSFTFIAGAGILAMLGYKPLFIDIDDHTLQPNIAQAEKSFKKYGNKIKGVLLCNTFGVGNTEINKWEKLCKKYNTRLVIDSAAGFGSNYSKSEKIGLRGDCEIFSLHATKSLAVGEGGIVSSKNKNLISNLRVRENFGFDSKRVSRVIGTNAKLQEINAVIGIRQLSGLEAEIKKRQHNLDYYKKLLSPAGFSFQNNDELSTVAFASVICPNAKLREKAIKTLGKNLVEVRQYYNPPVHKHPSIASNSEIFSSLKVTNDICSRIISLPAHSSLSQSNLHQICKLLLQLS